MEMPTNSEKNLDILALELKKKDSPISYTLLNFSHHLLMYYVQGICNSIEENTKRYTVTDPSIYMELFARYNVILPRYLVSVVLQNLKKWENCWEIVLMDNILEKVKLGQVEGRRGSISYTRRE